MSKLLARGKLAKVGKNHFSQKPIYESYLNKVLNKHYPNNHKNPRILIKSKSVIDFIEETIAKNHMEWTTKASLCKHFHKHKRDLRIYKISRYEYESRKFLKIAVLNNDTEYYHCGDGKIYIKHNKYVSVFVPTIVKKKLVNKIITFYPERINTLSQ